MAFTYTMKYNRGIDNRKKKSDIHTYAYAQIPVCEHRYHQIVDNFAVSLSSSKASAWNTVHRWYNPADISNSRLITPRISGVHTKDGAPANQHDYPAADSHKNLFFFLKECSSSTILFSRLSFRETGCDGSKENSFCSLRVVIYRTLVVLTIVLFYTIACVCYGYCQN